MKGLGLTVECLGFRVLGLGDRIEGLGFKVGSDQNLSKFRVIFCCLPPSRTELQVSPPKPSGKPL